MKIKRKPKIGDRVLVFKENTSAPTSGTIRHIGKLKGDGEFDSIWSDWDCERVFKYAGWRLGENKPEDWTSYNYTESCIFLLPEFIELKDWKKEKEWDKERKEERDAYDPLSNSYNDDCICDGQCICQRGA